MKLQHFNLRTLPDSKSSSPTSLRSIDHFELNPGSSPVCLLHLVYEITEFFKILILLGKKVWCTLVDDLRTALFEGFEKLSH